MKEEKKTASSKISKINETTASQEINNQYLHSFQQREHAEFHNCHT